MTQLDNYQSGLLIRIARVVDAIDQEITDANERKKELYAEVKEEISPETFRAWKEAIKLRRKRRADKDGCERHDEAVWRLLNLLEGPEVPDEAESPPAATPSPANGIVEEAAPTRARAGAHVHDAREAVPEYDDYGEVVRLRLPNGEEADPATGEILPTAEQVRGVLRPHAPTEPSIGSLPYQRTEGGHIDLTLPACLDRRAHKESAE